MIKGTSYCSENLSANSCSLAAISDNNAKS